MKAAFVKKNRKVRIREIETPVPEAGEVLLQIDGCGVCGSDHIEATSWARQWKRFGHEIAASIAAVGDGVAGFAPGDQVVLGLSAPCGECPQCQGGTPRRCTAMLVAEQGGFAEKLLVKDQRLLGNVPEPVSPSLLILVEPLTVLLDAFHTAALAPGDTLAVIGGGFLSRLGMLTAKALGIDSFVSLSRSSHQRLETCLQLVNGEHFLWKTLGGLKLSVPLPFSQRLAQSSGRVVVLHTPPPRYILNYLDAIPFDTTVVNIGLSGKKRDNSIKIDASQLIFKRVQLLSGFPVPCLYLDDAVRLLLDNQELFAQLTPDSVPLERLPEVISGKLKSKNKIMIVPQDRL